MKYLLLTVIFLLSATTQAGDILINESGVTCDIPEGRNTAPYNKFYNKKGMNLKKWCTFPHLKGARPNCTENGLSLGGLPEQIIVPCDESEK